MRAHLAGFTDVIETGTLQISGTLTPEDLTPESRAQLRNLSEAVSDEAVAFNYGFNENYGPLTISGGLGFSARYEVTARFDYGLHDVLISVDLELNVNALAKVEAETKRERELTTWKFLPIIIPTSLLQKSRGSEN